MVKKGLKKKLMSLLNINKTQISSRRLNYMNFKASYEFNSTLNRFRWIFIRVEERRKYTLGTTNTKSYTPIYVFLCK